VDRTYEMPDDFDDDAADYTLYVVQNVGFAPITHDEMDTLVATPRRDRCFHPLVTGRTDGTS